MFQMGENATAVFAAKEHVRHHHHFDWDTVLAISCSTDWTGGADQFCLGTACGCGLQGHTKFRAGTVLSIPECRQRAEWKGSEPRSDHHPHQSIGASNLP